MADGVRIVGGIAVTVKPDTTRFPSELRRKLREIQQQLKVDISVGVNARGLKTELRKAVKEAAAGLSVNVDVHASTRGLKGELRRGVAEASQGVDAKVGIDLNSRGLRGQVNRAVKEAGAGQKVNVGLNLGGLSGAAGGLGGIAGSIGGLLKLPIIAAGAIALAPALVSVAGAALAVAGSLTSVAAAGAVVPGIFAAMAAGAGVGIIALLGISKAVGALGKAHQTAGADAKTSATAQRASAAAIVSATEGVQRAQEALTQAHKDAKIALVDLRMENDRNSLSAERAAISLAEAQQHAVEVLSDPHATQLQKDSATLAVREAQQGLDEITTAHRRSSKELDSANKKGVAGSKQVKDAQRGVVDANRALVQAQTAAIEATTKQAASTTALADAMDGLSPAGRRFARFIYGLRGEWKQLQAVAQGGFLPGLQTGIAHMNSALFPSLLKMVKGTATELGKLAIEGANMVASGPWKADFAILAKRNVDLLDIGGHAAFNFADALRNIVIAAGPLLKRLATGVLHLSEWAKNASEAGRKSGKLGAFFDRVGDRIGTLWGILKNVAVTLYNIFSGGGTDLGDHLLENLEGITKKWAEWTGSDEGQKKIHNFFKKVKEIAGNLAHDVKSFVNKLIELADNPAVKKLIEFGEKHPGLVAGAAGGGFLAGKAGLPQAAGGVASGAGGLISRLLPGAAAGGAGAAAGAGALPALGPIAIVAAAVGVLVGNLILAWKHSQFFRDAWQTVVDMVKKHEEEWKSLGNLLFNVGKVIGVVAGFIFGTLLLALAGMIDVIGTVIHWYRSFQNTLRKVGGAIYDFAVGAIHWFGQFGDKVGGVSDFIKDTLLGLPKTVWTKVTTGIGTFIGGVKTAFEKIKDAVKAPFDWVIKNVFGRFFDYINKIPGVNIANPFKDWGKPKPDGSRTGNDAQGRAAGGAIYGPGGPKSDSIPAWLSNGEHVWTAEEVQKAGGHGAVSALRRAVKGFAAGGAATYGGSTTRAQKAGHIIESLFGPLPGGVGGRASSGHTSNSDHYTGNALDFMTLGNVGLGNRIAAYILSNFGKLAAKYVIWQQRINSGNGWKGMEDRGSPTANHRDHVHLSVLGAGIKSLLGSALGGVGGFAGDKISEFAKSLLGKATSRFKGNAIGQGVVGVAKQVMDAVGSKAGEQAAAVGGGLWDTITNPLGTVLGIGKGGNRTLGQKMAAARGWTGGQWGALEKLWTKESGWSTTADNPNSSAYGIPQALPGSKMASAGADWRTNAATQIAWGLNYIAGRYGSPAAAWAHSQKTNWYSGGGPVNSFANGGWINEPVVGKGLWSGQGYSFGEKGPEHVSPNGKGGPAIHIENAFFEDGADIDSLNHRAAFARMAGS